MFRKIRAGIIAALLGIVCLTSCTSEEGAYSDAPSSPTFGAASVPVVELVPVSFAEWEARRTEFVPDLLVVDLWATWCTPCLERFPHMVEMHHKYKDRGVQFVSLSLDDREDPSSIEFARTFLQEQKATFPNYLLDENIMDGFELIGIQTVPAVNIYNRNGQLVRELNNNNPNDQFSDADIERALLELLGDIEPEPTG